jgi:hypothetical protein
MINNKKYKDSNFTGNGLGLVLYCIEIVEMQTRDQNMFAISTGSVLQSTNPNPIPIIHKGVFL